MSVEITMPRLSDTMEAGTVVKWHVKEGDSVSAEQVIADIETDKATMELQTFDAGTVAKLAAAEGESVAVGTLIMLIAEEGEDPAEVAKAAGAGKPADKKHAAEADDRQQDARGQSAAGSAVAEQPTGRGDRPGQDEPGDDAGHAGVNGEAGGRIHASPLARKIAGEEGVDLSRIRGSGPGGRIVRKDVEAALASDAARGGAPSAPAAQAEQRPVAPAPIPVSGARLEARRVPLSNMRATIARRLVESKTTVPHYQVTVSVRLDALTTLREQLNTQLASQGVKLSVNDFLVRACALAMHQHPYVNSSWNPKAENGQPAIDIHGEVNIGVAVALPEERGGGLVVATIRNADQQGLRFISAETKRLAKKAREKGLTPEEMSGSTFTISNLGMFGVDHFTAIINPPNAAILAVGRAIERPFVETDEDGEKVIVVGHEMAMTMSSDHRIIDGAMAAQYLGTVKELLENPASLLV